MIHSGEFVSSSSGKKAYMNQAEASKMSFFAGETTANPVNIGFFIESENTSNEEVGNLKEQFEKLADEWREETKYLSFTQQIAMHSAYQRIIGLGESAIPLILEELSNFGGHWYWALNSITGENPVKKEDRGNISLTKKAWLEWGTEQGYF